MVDLEAYRNIIEKVWLVQLGGVKIPLLMVLVVVCFCLVIRYLIGSKLGQQFKAVGADIDKADMLGINVNKVRIQAIIISTVIACLGQIIYIQNIGMLNVYTGHLNSDIFASAALLAGGATIRHARVRHALLGIILFHSLFIVSPQAGQNIFGNAAWGEYFRSFVAYGTIAIALVLNMKIANYTSNTKERVSKEVSTTLSP
jgi:simple sugar transport system permease protein